MLRLCSDRVVLDELAGGGAWIGGMHYFGRTCFIAIRVIYKVGLILL
jgi:hypothetical protein